MQSRFERVLSILLTSAALAIAVTLVKREFFEDARSAVASPSGLRRLEFLPQWVSIVPSGVRTGSDRAPITIIEFADLECPFCRRFHEGALRSARAKYGDSIAVVYVHFPLSGHRFARPAARAAECAHNLGRFASFVDAVYARQDSLGLKSWASYAADAGVSDTVTFERCATANTPLALVDSGIAAGSRFDVMGTPTVIVNGWRFPSPPSDTALTHTIAILLSGRKPS